MMTTQQLTLDIPVLAPKPTTATPTATASRALSIRDALWTLDAASGRRQARRLTVRDLPGTWAARQWMHCGSCDGVLLVRWQDRDAPMAPGYWTGLAEGRVRLVVTQEPER